MTSEKKANPDKPIKMQVSKSWIKRLERVESPDVTYVSEAFPVVLEKGRGIRVQDVDKNKYLDFTSCFGVLALGHSNVQIKNAIRAQTSRMIHGMGDVHPTVSKIRLLEKLAELSPYDKPQSVLSLSGGEAVESAMKTAMLATGRSDFVSFEGAYHGLHLGALTLNSRSTFTKGFENWIGTQQGVVPFPVDLNEQWGAVAANPPCPWDHFEAWLDQTHNLVCQDKVLTQLQKLLKTKTFAAVVFEPVQGRGGDRTWPKGFWQKIQKIAKETKTLLIADEIYTGFGRTGKMFAHEWLDIVPDLLCVGKAMGGGLPLSACVGDATLFKAWDKSKGEAKHTSTFLGHPLACAVGRVALTEIQDLVKKQSKSLLDLKVLTQNFANSCARLNLEPFQVRGEGAMIGLWFYKSSPGFAAKIAEALLHRGFLILPSGPRGDVLSLAAPLIAEKKHYLKIFAAIEKCLKDNN